VYESINNNLLIKKDNRSFLSNVLKVVDFEELSIIFKSVMQVPAKERFVLLTKFETHR